MIILIMGASHTGKTALAQRLLEEYHYPYLSLDHLKMGLIRSRYTTLTPSDDSELVEYLWPITREIIKTAIENQQNLIIEGCYIPYDWKDSFSTEYLEDIRYICLVFTENYIREHYEDIRRYADVVEKRMDDSDLTIDTLIQDNKYVLEQCNKHGLEYILIDSNYHREELLKWMI